MHTPYCFGTNIADPQPLQNSFTSVNYQQVTPSSYIGDLNLFFN